MRIAISATNPCHLFPLARELNRLDALACYYSGYPHWKLKTGPDFPVRAHSLRTSIVYGLLKYAPKRVCPPARDLFLWQDHAFDRWVGSHLDACDFVHAMPGQALKTFLSARAKGIRTVLNHATGPVRDWVRIMEPEYARVGLRLTDVCPYDDKYFEREDAEYSMSDYHCAASSVVRAQLIERGIPAGRIWQVPYGADDAIFHPGAGRQTTRPAGIFRVIFAGQVGLRKGVRTLLDALTLVNRPAWEVDLYGALLPEAEQDLGAYHGRPRLNFHGAVSQADLAAAFCDGSILVLPSLEEGFGLVVPQAMNCGLPAVVSDRVGARDLITQHETGSIFPVRDAESLAAEMVWWEQNPRRIAARYVWSDPAHTLLTSSAAALS